MKNTYYITQPLTLRINSSNYGIWDTILGKDGHYLAFETIEEAKNYAEDNLNGEYYIIQIVG